MQVIESLEYNRYHNIEYISIFHSLSKDSNTCELMLAKTYKIDNNSSLAVRWEASTCKYGGLYVGENWNHSWKPLGFERNTCIYK